MKTNKGVLTHPVVCINFIILSKVYFKDTRANITFFLQYITESDL